MITSAVPALCHFGKAKTQGRLHHTMCDASAANFTLDPASLLRYNLFLHSKSSCTDNNFARRSIPSVPQSVFPVNSTADRTGDSSYADSNAIF